MRVGSGITDKSCKKYTAALRSCSVDLELAVVFCDAVLVQKQLVVILVCPQNPVHLASPMAARHEICACWALLHFGIAEHSHR